MYSGLRVENPLRSEVDLDPENLTGDAVAGGVRARRGVGRFLEDVRPRYHGRHRFRVRFWINWGKLLQALAVS